MWLFGCLGVQTATGAFGPLLRSEDRRGYHRQLNSQPAVGGGRCQQFKALVLERLVLRCSDCVCVCVFSEFGYMSSWNWYKWFLCIDLSLTFRIDLVKSTLCLLHPASIRARRHQELWNSYPFWYIFRATAIEDCLWMNVSSKIWDGKDLKGFSLLFLSP